MWAKFKDFCKNNITWARLAQLITPTQTYFYGILPPISSIITLLVISAVIAGGAWFAAGLWMGAVTGAISFIPFMEAAIVGVVGLSFANFWFHREINFFTLSARGATSLKQYSENDNPTELVKMVRCLTDEVNAYFAQIDQREGRTPQPMKYSALYTYSGGHGVEIKTAYGRNSGKSGIFFSDTCFLYHETGMNQRQLAALIQMELVKIKLRRGISRTIVGIGSDLLATLNSFKDGNLFLQAIYYLTVPLQFFDLLANSMSRSYEKEAGNHVVNMGRGVDLIDAIDAKVCSTLKPPSYKELLDQKDQSRRDARAIGYAPLDLGHSRFNSLDPVYRIGADVVEGSAEWLDKHYEETEDKTGWRVLAFLDLCVREFGNFFKEMRKKDIRATNLKYYLRPLIQAPNQNLDLNTATDAQIRQFIDPHQRAVNAPFYNQVQAANRYPPISPAGNGVVQPPQGAPGHGHQHGQNRLAAQVAQLNVVVQQQSAQIQQLLAFLPAAPQPAPVAQHAVVVPLVVAQQPAVAQPPAQPAAAAVQHGRALRPRHHH